ncbi:MATE family efflux transporter [Eubacterium sp. AF17-7]|nr:MATE family efflux transporter [Eubacterium sp. AF17-7]RGG67175.1 MATE family efflux transporter [Eubacterium sp. AF17-7]
MHMDLTQGNITGKLIKFALPLMLGNILQQCYNIADTLIVGRFVGKDALAAVGASYTLMIFLTSIILGLSMGAGAFISMEFGKKDYDRMKNGIVLAFVLIGGITLLITFVFFAEINNIIKFLQIPTEITKLTKQYLLIIGIGIIATFFYNFFGNGLRAIGNSVMPLVFLGVSAVLNIVLDLIFIVKFNLGVAGAAEATVISQYVSGMGITIYALLKSTHFRIKLKHLKFDMNIVKELANLSILTALQQSVMNFGILLVQGLVNSFGTIVMAAFAAAVKIDTLAYSPVQDFGNAVSTFVAQNYGAGKHRRIKDGWKQSMIAASVFCVCVSAVVFIFAEKFMGLFVSDGTEIIKVGAGYLRIEGSFYIGIGILFLLYGFYRAVGKPEMSLILTIISLGTRVVLAYALSAIPKIGVIGIWISVPIGWFLADMTGLLYMKKLPLLKSRFRKKYDLHI